MRSQTPVDVSGPPRGGGQDKVVNVVVPVKLAVVLLNGALVITSRLVVASPTPLGLLPTALRS